VEKHPEIGEIQLDWFRGYHNLETGRLEHPNNERVMCSGGIETACKRMETSKCMENRW
jgi:hypothetical protein